MNIREELCVLLFEKSKLPYARIFKRHKTPWGLSVTQLLNMDSGTLGHALGQFLSKNHFELIPRLERHDAYHILTDYGTAVRDEIALQFFCYGNGKRSKYLWMVMIVGTLLNPEQWPYFRSSYERGKRARKFFHWDFKDYLHRDLVSLKAWVFTE